MTQILLKYDTLYLLIQIYADDIQRLFQDDIYTVLNYVLNFFHNSLFIYFFDKKIILEKVKLKNFDFLLVISNIKCYTPAKTTFHFQVKKKE